MSKQTADSDIKVELMYIVYFILAFTLVIMFIGIILELDFTCQIILVKYLPIRVYFTCPFDRCILSGLNLF